MTGRPRRKRPHVGAIVDFMVYDDEGWLVRTLRGYVVACFSDTFTIAVKRKHDTETTHDMRYASSRWQWAPTQSKAKLKPTMKTTKDKP